MNYNADYKTSDKTGNTTGRERETREQRIERLALNHEIIVTGRRSNAPRPKRRAIHNPFIIFAGCAIIVFVATLLTRYAGRIDDSALAGRSSIVYFGGGVYSEYTAPVFGDINKNDLTFLGVLTETGDEGDFDSVGFDLGRLYSVDGYDAEQWLVVETGGKFILLYKNKE